MLYSSLTTVQWTYKRSFPEAEKASFSIGSEALLLLRESGFNMELSRWSVCVSNVIEFFQEQSNKTEKTIDGSVHGQRCSRTLEADRYFCWFSLVWYVIWYVRYFTCRLQFSMHVKIKTSMRRKSEHSINIKLSSVTRGFSSYLASPSD